MYVHWCNTAPRCRYWGISNPTVPLFTEGGLLISVILPLQTMLCCYWETTEWGVSGSGSRREIQGSPAQQSLQMAGYMAQSQISREISNTIGSTGSVYGPFHLSLTHMFILTATIPNILLIKKYHNIISREKETLFTLLIKHCHTPLLYPTFHSRKTGTCQSSPLLPLIPAILTYRSSNHCNQCK